MFPADVVKNIGVSKVYSVKNYGDYAGALINIETKDYPEKPFITISAGTGFNTISTFNEHKFSSTTVKNAFWGAGTQDRYDLMPEEYKVVNRNQTSKGTGKDIFASDMSYKTAQSMPSISMGIAGGKLFKVGERLKMGLLISSSFDNKYEFFDDTFKADLKSDGTPFALYSVDEYAYNTLFTNLVNYSLIFNPKQIIKINLFHTKSTSDVVDEKRGYNSEGTNIFARNMQFEEKSLLYSQIIGTHLLREKLSLEYKLGFAKSTDVVPDRRQNSFDKPEAAPQFTPYALNAQESLRFFSDEYENSYNGSLVFDYKAQEGKHHFCFGTESMFKQKSYESYVFYYNYKALDNYEVDPQSPMDLFSEQHFAEDLIYVTNGNSYPMKYNGMYLNVSGFADYVFTVNKLTYNMGIRYEYSDMTIYAYNNADVEVPYTIKSHDFFPALNIKYAATPKSNIRFSASRTITRPSFNEKSPALVIPKMGEKKTVGEPNNRTNVNSSIENYLDNAYNYNIDIKWEWFPKSKELISIGFYGKYLDEPIERIAKPQGGSIVYSFKNTQKGIAAGFEVEVKKYLTEQFFVGSNFSYIYTLIEVDSNANDTEKRRAMQGASPFLLNADLGYDFLYGKDKKHSTRLSLVYNVYGKRMYAVGANGVGSIFEMPFHSFDCIVKTTFSKKFGISLSAKNILDFKKKLTQGYGEYNNDNQSYINHADLEETRSGRSFSLSLSYSF
ncbi:MAG: TonB-dependent receptor [Bacteroidales bacterium]|nr:TonB-dependent receptor [Bacteroidales bacterium]